MSLMGLTGRLLTCILVISLLAPLPVGAAAPEPSSAPVAFGESLLVRGRASCGGITGEQFPPLDPSGSVEVRGVALGCTAEYDDPRVSGTFTIDWNYDGWGDDALAGADAGVRWGAVRLENEGGAWEGWHTGMFAVDTGDMISMWLEGTDGYAGLSFFARFETPPGDATTGYDVVGLIFPGDPPPFGPEPPAAASGTAPGQPQVARPRFRSPAFAAGGAIPRRFTCDGLDVSPELEWSGFGTDVAEYAVVVIDPDAGGFVHWVVSGIPGDSAGLPEGAGDPAGDWPWRQGTNDFGRRGWGGPCPPARHVYEFRLYASPGSLRIKGALSPAAVAAAARAAGATRQSFTASYARP